MISAVMFVILVFPVDVVLCFRGRWEEKRRGQGFHGIPCINFIVE